MSEWHEIRGRYASLSDEEKKAYRAAYNKEWRERNPGYRSGYKMDYGKQHPATRLWWAAKRRAKVKGLPFDITKEDIIVPEFCPYLGITLTVHAPRGSSRETVCSLDRIIPELGYVKGNIEVISHLANTMKQYATQAQLVSFAKKVLEK